MVYDFIVVGQGLAGSILADHLLQSGRTVLVIDQPKFSNSSRVAAGLYNPITGRKMVKTWNGDALFDYLIPYYKDLEARLGANFLIEMPIYRPFISIEEQNEWMGKSADTDYSSYVRKMFDSPAYPSHLNDPYGGILLDKCGYLDTTVFLESYRKYLNEMNCLSEEHVDSSQIKLNADSVSYGRHSAQKIIFSDGQLLTKNTFFNWLPIRPVKGEVLFIRVKESIDVIYNRGVFVAPIGNGICKVGSTYNHHNLNNIATEEAKKELSRKLADLVKFPFEIVDQKAGIRPATKDRRPFVGVHPEHKQVGIFNGLGAKGVSLAPYYANQFVEWLTEKGVIDPEANIRRFFSLY